MPSPNRRTPSTHAPQPHEPEPARRWADLEDAAAYLTCSTKTVRRMIARGEITGYRVGSRMVRIDLNDLDDLARPIPTATAADRAAAGVDLRPRRSRGAAA